MTWGILDSYKDMKVVKTFPEYETAWDYYVEEYGTGGNRFIIYNLDNDKSHIYTK